MRDRLRSRRGFLKSSALAAGALYISPRSAFPSQNESLADYVLHIQSTALEIAPKRIVSAVTYNGQFPGPLLRFKEGQQAVVDGSIHRLHNSGEKLLVRH